MSKFSAVNKLLNLNEIKVSWCSEIKRSEKKETGRWWISVPTVCE